MLSLCYQEGRLCKLLLQDLFVHHCCLQNHRRAAKDVSLLLRDMYFREKKKFKKKCFCHILYLGPVSLNWIVATVFVLKA